MNKNMDYNLYTGDLFKKGNFNNRLNDKIKINNKFIDKLIHEVKLGSDVQVTVNIKTIQDYGKPTYEVTAKNLVYYLQYLCNCQVTYSNRNEFTFFRTLKPSLTHNTDSEYYEDIDTEPQTEELYTLPMGISLLIMMIGFFVNALWLLVFPNSFPSGLFGMPVVIAIIFLVYYYIRYYMKYLKTQKIVKNIYTEIENNR